MSDRISYNGKNIDFTADCFALQIDYPRLALVNQSASGLVETLNVRADVQVAISFRNFVNSITADATLKRNLQQWFGWAQEGNAWTFARDSAEVANTTLTGSNAVGDSTLQLTTTAGVTAGKAYIIRSLTHLELVKVQSVDSGVQVTLTETLNFAYASSSRFRSEQYWPATLGVPTNSSTGQLYSNPILEMPPLHFNVLLNFFEDVTGL